LAAVGHLLRYQARREAQPEAMPRDLDLDHERRAARRARLGERGDHPLGEGESKALLAEYGIPVSVERLVASRSAAVRAARTLGLPVVLKTAAPGVLHKSDRGGVVLKIATLGAVGRTYLNLRAAFGPLVSVQPWIDPRDGVELFLGMVRDEQFGPVISVGFGGLFVEVLRDTAVFLPPVGPGEAERLVRRLRGFPLLAGARGRRPVDLAAVCRAIAAFSSLSAELGDVLTEVDLNPLLATPDGVIALDALIVPRAPDHPLEPAPPAPPPPSAVRARRPLLPPVRSAE
jgi:hypothetical protein